MFLNNTPIKEINLPDKFATFFRNKVQNIVNNQIIDRNVYNGTQKIVTNNMNLMLESDVLNATKTLKNKNCEGHHCIPLRILADGVKLLQKPLATFFDKIYLTKTIPEQW